MIIILINLGNNLKDISNILYNFILINKFDTTANDPLIFLLNILFDFTRKTAQLFHHLI